MNFMNIDSITYHNNQINACTQGQGHRRRQCFLQINFSSQTLFGKLASQVHFMNIDAVTFHINQLNALGQWHATRQCSHRKNKLTTVFPTN